MAPENDIHMFIPNMQTVKIDQVSPYSVTLSTVRTNPVKQFLKSHFAPAFFFLSAPRRRALKVLYAVCRIVDDAVDSPTENPDNVLNAWRQVFSENRSDAVAPFGHKELASEFLMVSKTYDIPLFLLLDLINKGVAVDLKNNRFMTPMDTEAYCYGVASTVGLACLPIFGVPLEQAKEFAVRLGIAVQWTNLIRDVGTDAKLGRIYIPMEHLEKFECKESDILNGHSTPQFLQLMAYEGDVARSHYRRAAQLMPDSWKKQLRPARIMGKIYLMLLEKVAAQGYPVLEKRISLNIFEKVLATWRALRD